MHPSTMILGGLAVWLGVLVFTVAHALGTGRIRLGRMGDEAISRAADPARFWTTFSVSVGGLLVLGVLLRLLLRAILPAAWVAAMQTLGL